MFDKEAVQSELDLQRTVSQDFSQTSQQAGTEINRKAKEHDDKAEQLDQAAAKADAEGNKELAQALAAQVNDERKKAAAWQRGGVLLNMISAGLSAPTQSTAGVVAASASPALSYEIGQHFKARAQEGSLQHILAHAILGAAVAAAGDNNTLAGAISAGGAEAAAPYISKWLYDEQDGSKLTAEQKETVTSITKLLGAATGATIGNSATDTVQSSLNAQSAIENNTAAPLIIIGREIAKNPRAVITVGRAGIEGFRVVGATVGVAVICTFDKNCPSVKDAASYAFNETAKSVRNTLGISSENNENNQANTTTSNQGRNQSSTSMAGAGSPMPDPEDNRQKKGKPNNNQAQNKQVQDAARAEKLDRNQQSALKRAVENESRQGANLSYQEIREIAREIKNGTW